MDESIVYTTLRDDAGVGAICADRIYPVIALQDTTRPYVVYTLVSAVPQNQLDGDYGCDNRRVQLDSYAETYAQARGLADAVRTSLSAIGYLTVENFVTYEVDTKLFRVSQDYSFYL